MVLKRMTSTNPWYEMYYSTYNILLFTFALALGRTCSKITVLFTDVPKVRDSSVVPRVKAEG